MTANYKKLSHRITGEVIPSQDLIRISNIFANIITELHTEKYISLEKVEGICTALHRTPDDILEFIAEDEK